jgi:hypothetical protein
MQSRDLAGHRRRKAWEYKLMFACYLFVTIICIGIILFKDLQSEQIKILSGLALFFSIWGCFPYRNYRKTLRGEKTFTDKF